jgi:hypothetical protein
MRHPRLPAERQRLVQTMQNAMIFQVKMFSFFLSLGTQYKMVGLTMLIHGVFLSINHAIEITCYGLTYSIDICSYRANIAQNTYVQTFLTIISAACLSQCLSLATSDVLKRIASEDTANVKWKHETTAYQFLESYPLMFYVHLSSLGEFLTICTLEEIEPESLRTKLTVLTLTFS